HLDDAAPVAVLGASTVDPAEIAEARARDDVLDGGDGAELEAEAIVGFLEIEVAKVEPEVGLLLAKIPDRGVARRIGVAGGDGGLQLHVPEGVQRKARAHLALDAILAALEGDAIVARADLDQVILQAEPTRLPGPRDERGEH